MLLAHAGDDPDKLIVDSAQVFGGVTSKPGISKTVSIDFTTFPDGTPIPQNLDGEYGTPGTTLVSRLTNEFESLGVVFVNPPGFVSVLVGPPSCEFCGRPPVGGLLVGGDPAGNLRMKFRVPVRSVTIEIIGSGLDNAASLEAFNTQGVSLGSVTHRYSGNTGVLSPFTFSAPPSEAIASVVYNGALNRAASASIGGLTFVTEGRAKYTITQLRTIAGGTYTSAARMNNAGGVVGSADDSKGGSVAVAWKNGAPSILYNIDPLLGGYSDAVAINNHGVIVGNVFESESSVFETGPNVSAWQGFDHGIFVGAINDSNVIAGVIWGHPVLWAGVDISHNPDGLPTTANNDGVFSLPSGINDAGVIVGTESDWLPDYSDTHPVAVRWKPDPTTHAPGASVKALAGLGGRDSAANAVNVNGWVVGWATLGNKLQHAVLWEGNAGPFDLGTLGGKESSANGINAEGDVAGEAQTASGAWHAVLWTHLSFKATDLNLEISPALAKQFTLISAVDTNDRCMVLANGVDNKTGVAESFVLSLTDQSHCNRP